MRLSSLAEPRFLVYIGGGILTALIDIGLLQFLIFQGVEPLAAASAGFMAGLCVNYAFHAKVTFNNVSTLAKLARFLGVVAVNYLMTLCFVAAADALLLLPLIGKLVSLPFVAVNGFLLSKYWVFK